MSGQIGLMWLNQLLQVHVVVGVGNGEADGGCGDRMLLSWYCGVGVSTLPYAFVVDMWYFDRINRKINLQNLLN